MRKGLLLAGAIFGAAVMVNTANAVTIRIDDEQKIVFGARGIIDAVYKDKRNDNDKSDLVFAHREARIYAKYRFNKFLSAGLQAMLWTKKALNDKLEPQDGIEVIDSFINISIAPEFQIMAGSYKVPFQRHSGLQSGWSVLFPTGPTKGDFTYNDGSVKVKVKHVFTNPVAHKPFRSSSRSAGLTFWGNIADGMFKYYVGVFDTDDETKKAGDPKTAYAIRVQFTPTMLGYKGEKGYVLKNTYVGKKDILTIGISYVNQDFRGTGYDTQSSWGVDLMWEQKFGSLVPNIQIGYVNHKNYLIKYTDLTTNKTGSTQLDTDGWLVQGQLLYDQKIWIGKPAIVAKYIQSKYDSDGGDDPKLTTWGIGINYFIKGYANRISLAVDNVSMDNVNKEFLGGDDSYTDVTLSIFYNF